MNISDRIIIIYSFIINGTWKQSYFSLRVQHILCRYLNYFKDVEPAGLPSIEILRSHRITILHEPIKEPGVLLRIANFCAEGRMTHYDAYLGIFKLRIEVFHAEEPAPMSSCPSLGSGGFGAIFQQSKSSKQFVVKLQKRYDFNRQ